MAVPPRASNVAMERALASVGWDEPAESAPVAPWVLPVLLLGGAAVKTKFLTGSATLGAVNTYTAIFTVPAGKQWKLLSVGGYASAATSAQPGMQPAGGTAHRMGALNLPDGSVAAGAASSHFQLSDSFVIGTTNGGGGFVLGPGDTVGAFDVSLGGAVVNLYVTLEETDVPREP